MGACLVGGGLEVGGWAGEDCTNWGEGGGWHTLVRSCGHARVNRGAEAGILHLGLPRAIDLLFKETAVSYLELDGRVLP